MQETRADVILNLSLRQRTPCERPARVAQW